MRGRLIVAMFVGPAAAAIDMVALYVLVAGQASKTLLHSSTAVAFGVAVLAALYAARFIRSEERFLALMASALGAFFAVLILAFEIPATLLGPRD